MFLIEIKRWYQVQIELVEQMDMIEKEIIYKSDETIKYLF